jgi:amino acid transporter
MAPSADEVTPAPSNAKKTANENEKTVSEIALGSGSDSSSDTDQPRSDVEKHGAGPESLPMPDLKRKLKSRHLQMIAIGESEKREKKSFIDEMLTLII